MLRARLDELRTMLMLLTRLPVGRFPAGPPPLAAAAWAMPVAGALAALPAAMVFAAAALVLPPLMAALLALAAGMLTTGALHEDGLADTCDGFGGGRSPAEKLEIMRDSRLGSYGGLALVVAVGLRAAGLASAPDAATGAAALVILGAASRAAVPLAVRWLPGARDEGMATTLRDVPLPPALIAAAVGVAALALSPAPLLALAAMTLAALLVARLCLRQIGGYTGDVLGTIQQAGEIAGWVVFAAVW